MAKQRKIRLATLFSGIGAIEQAFLRLDIPHEIVFACDNGEIEFVPLEPSEQKLYAGLKKQEKSLSDEENGQLDSLKQRIDGRISEIRRQVAALGGKEAKRRLVNELYRRYVPDGKHYVKQTYFSNYAISEADYHLDVRFLDGSDYAGAVDIMVGGSPCQSFSSNGKRGGIEDARGTLFAEYARIIDEVRPKCFIFENVKGMLVHDGGRTWKIVRSVFQSLDYTICLHHDKEGNELPLLNATDYGIPQNRERIFLVGFRNGLTLRRPFVFPKPLKLSRFVPDFLEENVDAKYYLGEKGFAFVTTHPTRAQVGASVMNCQKANQQFNWNGDFIFEPLSDRHTAEIRNRAYVGEWRGQTGVCRKFTPRECLRLMGYPDSFRIVVSDNVMYRQAGNSIVVNVLECLLREIIKTGIFKS